MWIFSLNHLNDSYPLLGIRIINIIVVAMNIENKEKATNSFNDLTPIQKRCFVVATMAAFAGVFVWFVKIIFF